MDLGSDSIMMTVDLPSTSMVLSSGPGPAFLQDPEVASTCPLLTPSPPTNALVINERQNGDSEPFIDGDVLADKLQQVEQGDSSSSGSSVLVEPASEQLLHNYINLTKSAADGIVLQENGTRSTAHDVPYSRKVEDTYFIQWNWPVIRRLCVISSLTTLLALVALVIAMIATLPKTCNPPLPWHQGSLLYEIFPASFQNSKGIADGNFKGLAGRARYIEKLGVRGIRLNSIFLSPKYPEDFRNVSSLFKIDPSLGRMKDFNAMIDIFHTKNIAVMLDLPTWPPPAINRSNTVRNFSEESENDINRSIFTEEDTHKGSDRQDLSEFEQTITNALKFWLDKGVDGFYLKGLEKYVENACFAQTLREWKLLLGAEKVLMVSYEVFERAPSNVLNILLSRVDLVDVKLDFSNGSVSVRKQIEAIQGGVLWSRPGAPWVQWSAGNVESRRLSAILPEPNCSLAATLIQMMLPGTPSIFYGDEIGLGEVIDKQGDRGDQKHLHQLTTMLWDQNDGPNSKQLLPWLPGDAYVNFAFKDIIAKMTVVRTESPAIYVNGIWKDGTTTCNSEVRYSSNNTLVIERSYPRRNSYVIVSNLGTDLVIVDLPSLFYSGTVIIGPRPDMENTKIEFKHIRLWAGESVVVKIDK